MARGGGRGKGMSGRVGREVDRGNREVELGGKGEKRGKGNWKGTGGRRRTFARIYEKEWRRM